MDKNHLLVTKGFDILTRALAPYVARVLRSLYRDEWWSQGVQNVLQESQRRGLPVEGDDSTLIATLDPALCLTLMNKHWWRDGLFWSALGGEARLWINELTRIRNRWAHKGSSDMKSDMKEDDAWQALDTMARLAEKIDAESTKRLRSLARNVRYGQEETPMTTSNSMTERSLGAGKETRNRVNRDIVASTEDFKKELRALLNNTEKQGKRYIDVKSGDLHRQVGGYPGSNHRMPLCCNVMYGEMSTEDEVIKAPPKGKGASVVIRYQLPRKNMT